MAGRQRSFSDVSGLQEGATFCGATLTFEKLEPGRLCYRLTPWRQGLTQPRWTRSVIWKRSSPMALTITVTGTSLFIGITKLP